MKNRMGVLTVVSLLAVQAVASADLITGTVESVNTSGNEITLKDIQIQAQDAQGKAETKEMAKVTWKDDLPGMQSLENAKPGQQLTLDVDRTLGRWEIKRIGDQASQSSQFGEPSRQVSQVDQSQSSRQY